MLGNRTPNTSVISTSPQPEVDDLNMLDRLGFEYLVALHVDLNKIFELLILTVKPDSVPF